MGETPWRFKSSPRHHTCEPSRRDTPEDAPAHRAGTAAARSTRRAFRARPVTRLQTNTTATLTEFRELIVQVWQEGVFGVNLSDTLTALLILLLFLVLRNFFGRLLLRILKRAAVKPPARGQD